MQNLREFDFMSQYTMNMRYLSSKEYFVTDSLSLISDITVFPEF